MKGNANPVWDVIVIGGGNAALCAALSASEAGANVLMLESAPREWRGGNTQHTRNLRCMHDAPQDVLLESYPEEEYWQDLYKVTGGITNEKLARMVIRSTATCRDWMRKHGVRFQPSLSGTLHLSRTNAFFMGGGKALVNAYYRSAESIGVQVRYDSPVDALEIRDHRFHGVRVNGEFIAGRACVIASGGFESNLEWLREVWGQNERGEWPADNFRIRGTRFNKGTMLKFMQQQGADMVGDPSQSHCVAVDARAPLYDGGICTRVDCVAFGIMVNNRAERFYDEGEDFWPKRYAIWGRLVAMQPAQIGYSIIDSKVIGRFMPPVFPGEKADSIEELAEKLGIDPAALRRTVDEFNATCRSGSFDHTVLDDCRTEGLTPAKTHWAQPIDKGPFYGFALRPGITFTYLSLKTDEKASIFFDGKASPNMFAAGEIISGNVLGKGYIGGTGMAIGTAFGRIAGTQATLAAQSPATPASLAVAQASKQLEPVGNPMTTHVVAWPLRHFTHEEAEVARVMEVCNACRYCEGFCAVFPAMARRVNFFKADIHYLANLCHNCGACLHSCQYASPHEFAINVPRSMAKVRVQTYSDYAWPPGLGRVYRKNGLTLAFAAVFGLSLFLLIVMYVNGGMIGADSSGNFYSVLPHNTLVMMFGTVFGFAILALGIGVSRFWRAVTPGASLPGAASEAATNALTLKYLDGGHGEGCNEADDGFTLIRRRFHHLTFYGFMLCLAATSVATLYHYVLEWSAPYPFFSLPVLLGTVGGIGLLIGPVGLFWLNRRRPPEHGDPHQRAMDRGFIMLLFATSLTGLALLAARESTFMPALFAVHLGTVMAFFLTMPYSKFAHGFYRSAALLKSSIERRMPNALKLESD